MKLASLLAIFLFASQLGALSHDVKSSVPISSEGFLTLPDQPMQVNYRNPNIAVWEKAPDLDPINPRPGANVFSLRRKAIVDSRGVGVTPVISVFIFALPSKEITTREYFEARGKNGPFRIVKTIDSGEQIITHNLKEYGGYTHKVIRVFEVKDGFAMQVSCDATDTVYSEVEADFLSWVAAARLTSRSSRTPPALPSALSQHFAISAPLIVSVQARPLSFNR